jgi:hypothetical protein
MLNFFHEAGFGVWPVTVVGVFTLVVALRYAWARAPSQLALVLGGGAFTLLAGVLGSVVGFQSAIGAANGQTAVVLLGAREALNNLVLALMMVTVACGFVTFGAWRAPRLQR